MTMRGNNAAVLNQFMAMLQSGGLNGIAVARKAPAKKAKRKSATKSRASDEEIEASKQKNNDLVIEAFTAAGYEDVQPRVNVLTYGKWEEQGRRVRKGEKSLRVGNFPLFHISQTDEIADEA
jgi:hypothetical protein